MANSTANSEECPLKIYVQNFPDVGVIEDNYPVADFLEPDFELPPIGNAKFRWFHIPANNMAWVEQCAKKLVPELSGLDEKAWTLKLLPALSQIPKPLHARQMEPSCISGKDVSGNRDESAHTGNHGTGPDRATSSTSGSQSNEEGLKRPMLTLYLPYLNWEYYDDFFELQQTYDYTQHGAVDMLEDASRARVKVERNLAQYLGGDLPLHPRRSLDQFYYSSLADTYVRDTDQTISKWSGAGLEEDGRRRAANDSLLIMVDQVWCWVLNEKVVLSFFPSHETQYRRHDENGDFKGLYDSIRSNCAGCPTVWDFYSLLVKEATTHLFSQENRKFMDLIGVYRWVTSKKAAYQTMYFQEFQYPDSDEFFGSKVLDDRRELKLVLEVADIIDELKMIRHLINTQREVLKNLISALREFSPSGDIPSQNQMSNVVFNNATSTDKSTMIFNIQHQFSSSQLIETTKLLAQAISVPARDSIIFTEEMLVSVLTEIATITQDAEYTHQMLLNLLDLKQKTASLFEARSTTKQGRAIMLFTIITIVFLPLSFFTSYFGQNVSEITGSDQNPTTWELWRVGTPITLAVILSALCVAFFIMYPNSCLCFCQRRNRRKRGPRPPNRLSLGHYDQEYYQVA